ncbi:MAG: transglutaminase-like domain-containing protein [Planctomycetota bacterium]|nr:transglutaminase-like domain-containing protein [Planctomycetota bacterium]
MKFWSRAALMLVCTIATLIARPSLGADQDNWAVLLMNGQRSGWQNTRTTERDGTITTESKVSMSVGRGATKLTVAMETRFVETTDGKPVRMWLRQQLAAAPVEQTWEWGEKDVGLTVVSGDQKQEQRVDKPEGTWLTPAAAEREVLRRMKSGEKEITLRTVDPTLGLQVVEVTRKDFTPAKVEIAGKQVNVTRCTSTISGYPESIEYLDENGQLVKVETNLGGFNVVMQRSDRATALGEIEGAELMVSTFVRPDKVITNARHVASGVYRLTLTEGAMPGLPSVGGQTVTREGDALIVAVSARGSSPAADHDAQNAAFTKPSTMVNFEDDRVKKLAKVALANAGQLDAAKKAEALRRFVHAYIDRKELGVGFASAGEIARTRTGDCTEHGVLLAALLRAHGIPSRVASGLVFADRFAGSENIFGYHMWAQALLEVEADPAKPGVREPRWVDLDATLADETPFDATHITISTSGLEDGVIEKSMLTTAQLMGRLKIEVKKAE